MNRKNKYLMVCTILISLLSTPPTLLYAAEQVGTTQVTADFTEDDLFKLEVHISEGGKVLQGTSVLEKGIITYQLSLDDDITFKLTPDKGYKVKSVIFEKPIFDEKMDLTHLIKDSSILIDTEGTEMKLYITFEKTDGDIEEPEIPEEPEEPEIPDRPSEDKPEVENPKEEIYKPGGNIQTGDQTNVARYTTLLSLAGIFIILVIKRKKQEEEDKGI